MSASGSDGMVDRIEGYFAEQKPSDVRFVSLRFVRSRDETLSVRQNLVQPVARQVDAGAMLTVATAGGGLGYAASSDLSRAGIGAAITQAKQWANACDGRMVADFSQIEYPHNVANYSTPIRQSWDALPLDSRLERLRRACSGLRVSDKIVDWEAAVWSTEIESLYLTGDGGRQQQVCQYLVPTLSAVAYHGSETQQRTFGRDAYCRQGGAELLDDLRFDEMPTVIGQQAVQLLDAPNCPDGRMALLLAPDQMILQIHESIGHPLEIDRVLGDERNYAGSTFVTPEMFGSYQYGSPLLNVCFEPQQTQGFASYAADDEGEVAVHAMIIEDGVLKRGLGSISSQTRSGLAGVACSRASSWARPAIDRMANLNIKPGASSFDEMVAAVDYGVLMRTNSSWSIDDCRNKFQFGCEWGQLIEDGQLTQVVRNPNYRGRSADFWRSLNMVGNASTVEALGSPYCGKGEPNQVIRVGHTSPACLFSDVDVFGGEA